MGDSFKNLVEKFLMFEEENQLFKREKEDVLYWHLVRFNIYNEILSSKQRLGENHYSISKSSLIRRIYLKFLNVNNILFHNPKKIKNTDLLMFNHSRRVKNDEVFECIYTDMILENISLPYAVIERPYNEFHYKPVRTKNIAYTDIHDIIIPVKKRIYRLFSSKHSNLEIEDLIKKINDTFHVDLDIRYWINFIENAILSFKLYNETYVSLLRKIKPKLIIEVVSYDIQRFALNSAASHLKIPTIELQHGTMGRYHIAYNFPQKLNLDTFPDYIFTFSQFWKDNTRFPLDKEKVKVIGWPYFENKVNLHKENQITKSNANKTILFISQGIIGKELSKMAYDIAEILHEEKYSIIYKLHPGEYDRWRTEYPWLIKSKLEVIDSNSHDMHYYFAKADIQIGVSSTAIFEGLGYGLKTIVIKLPGYEYMEELFNNSLAYLANDVDEAIESIKDNSELNESNIEYFWKTDSIQNFKNQLKNIMQKSVEV